MQRLLYVILLSILVCCLLSGTASTADNQSDKSLEILCAGAMRPPVEEMLATYQNQTGVHMQISYSPANILLQQIKMRPHGDVFIPADRYYTDQAIKAGVAEAPSVFAYLIPVIIVQKGNPFNVHTLSDMTRNDIRVGLVDERIGAIGRLFVALLKKNHIKLDQLNTVFNAPMVGELANAIKLKSIDVAVVWKPVAMAYQKEADYLSIPENKNIVVPVSAGIIKTSSNKPDARKFLKFMTSKEGKAILEKYHYPTTDPRKH